MSTNTVAETTETNPPTPFHRLLLPTISFAAGITLEFYALFYHINLSFSSLGVQGEIAGFQILYFLAFCLVYVFLARNAGLIYRYRRLALVASVVLILLPFCMQAIAATFPEYRLLIYAVNWIALGAGLCVLRTMWELFHSVFFTRFTEILVSLSFICGVIYLVPLVGSSPNRQVFFVIYAALICISVVCGIVLMSSIPAKLEKLVFASKQFSTYITADILANAAQGIVFGYVVFSVINLGSSAGIPILATLFAGSVTALIIIVLRKRQNYSLALLLDRLLPLAVALLLISPLLDENPKLICYCAILSILVYAQIRKISLGAVLNNRLSLNPITHSTLVPLPYMVGTSIGFLTAIAFTFYLHLQKFDLFFALLIYTLIIIIILYFGALTGVKLSHHRQSSEDAAATKTASMTFSTMSTSRETPFNVESPPYHGRETLQEYQEHHLENSGAQALKRILDARCEQIVEERGLTRREADVFRLLARGRNAGAISNTLYISLATAKTHIYRIYAKLEISSQQQLLDIFEE